MPLQLFSWPFCPSYSTNKIMFRKVFSLIAYSFFYFGNLPAQITGSIQDNHGNPLPFASVYQENTTKGTVANENGIYEFTPADQGNITLVFQYVGYQKKSIQIHYKGSKTEVYVVLIEDPALVEEIVIKANREDPAYAIIRNAIAVRNQYNPWLQKFEADLYIKGVVKLEDAPEKFMGQEIKDLDGILDSTRNGILYLRESQSKYYFLAPDNQKEVMLSTKSSGSESIYGLNRFSQANVNLYQNYIPMGRSVLSPIADNAFSLYDFKLLGITLDEASRSLYKISVIPKSETTPLFSGVIYIVGDTWNFHSIDLFVSGKNLKTPIFDSIRFQQIYLPLASGEWPLFSQTNYLHGSAFGFKIVGSFNYIFSNYNTNSEIESVFKSKETFSVEKTALNQDSIYWAKNRPIPLTPEEEKDYIKKDSLQIIWNSDAYLDSIDRESNRFKAMNLITGYRYSNHRKNYNIRIDPLSTVRYNVVEGWNLSFQPTYTHNDSTEKKLEVTPLIVYGFADKTWKSSLLITKVFDPQMLGEWQVEFGKKYEQYDENHPIQLRSNTWSSLFYRQNYIRLFSKEFVKLQFKKEIVNGIYIQAAGEFAHRSPLSKKSDFSFFYLERIYDSNVPKNAVGAQAYLTHDIFSIGLNFKWIPGQTYSTYPNNRIRNSGKWPTFTLENKYGYTPQADNKLFSTMRLTIHDTYVNARQLGYFSYAFEWAGSVINNPTYFQDFLHPLGNEWVIPQNVKYYSYALLPFYRFSTKDYYMGCHFKHHFNGFIMDKIPLLRKTSLKMTLAANYLYNPDYKNYFETGIGIENILVGPLPLGSIEYYWSWSSYLPKDSGFIIKLFF